MERKTERLCKRKVECRRAKIRERQRQRTHTEKNTDDEAETQIERNSKPQTETCAGAKERRDREKQKRKRANTHLEKEGKKPADNPGGCRRQKPSPPAVSGPIAPRFPSLAGKGLFSGCVCEGSGRRAEVSLSLFRPGLCVYLHVTGLSG